MRAQRRQWRGRRLQRGIGVRLNGGGRRRPGGIELFDAKPQPFGVAFTGMACSEPKLLTLAYAFEQATKRRVAPPLPPARSASPGP